MTAEPLTHDQVESIRTILTDPSHAEARLSNGYVYAERLLLEFDRLTGLVATLRMAGCGCYPDPRDHEDECPHGVPTTVPEPHFDRGLRFVDGRIYNLHRDYTDATGTVWRATGRDDETPLWIRSSAEMGWPIETVVECRGHLTLVYDAFFDATDEQLAAQALSRPNSAGSTT
jgi:hypothetical protein